MVIEHSASGGHHCRCVAVIRLVGSSDARQADGLLGDVSGGGALLGNRVVVQIGAAQCVGQGHRFAHGHILVAEGAGAGYCQVIARDFVVEHSAGGGHGGRCAAVIGFAGGRDTAQADGFLVDIGGGAGLICDGVVAQICATQGVAQGHRLAGGRVLVAECAGAGHREHIACHLVVEHRCAHRNRCSVGAVIGLVGGGDAAQGDGLLVDVGRGAGLLSNAVVAQVRTAQGVGQAHGFARSRVLVAEDAGAGHREVIARDFVVEQGAAHRHGGSCAAVISLVGCSDARQGDGLLGDVSGRRSLLSHGVVAQIGTAQGVGQGHRFACGHIFVTEAAGAVHREHITCDLVIENSRAGRHGG